jgi:hypothetical protein
MFGLSLGALALGAAIAASASRWPAYQARLEGLSGGMLVCGLGLLGFELPLFR